MIEEDRNQACVEIGPLVYCIETPDADAVSLDDLLLPVHPQFCRAEVDICGRTIPCVEAKLLRRSVDEAAREQLYRTFEPEKLTPVTVRMIPYFAWDNRGMGEMKIWLPLAWREA